MLQATAPESHSRAALETLCRTYWYPLYAYARRAHGRDDAEDLVQGFFARLIEKRDFHPDPGRGRFRAFLLAALRHYLANERDRQRTVRSGGGERLISIDAGEADSRFALEIQDGVAPETLYERQYALALLDEAWKRLREEQQHAKKEGQFEVLRIYLTGTDEPPYAEVAHSLSISEGAARVAVHRLRKRFGELVRLAVLETVADPAEVDDEIQALFRALRA